LKKLPISLGLSNKMICSINFCLFLGAKDLEMALKVVVSTRRIKGFHHLGVDILVSY